MTANVRAALWCLCCNCGAITNWRRWTHWQREDDEDGLDQHWRPSRDGEGDPMSRCPECKCEHQDGDYSPGFYLGTREEMIAERAAIADDYLDDWAENSQPQTSQ